MEDKEEEDDGFNKKEDLRALNQRLAGLINQGIVLEKALSEINKKNALNVKSIKDLYAEELSLLRARLDETAEEKVLAQRECMSLNDKCLLLQKNFKSAEAETELVQSKITVMEEKLLKAEIDLGKRKCDLEKLQEKSQVLATELEKASSELDKTKKKLTQETVAKVTLMNEIQTLKEEMSFNESLHTKEMSSYISIDEFDKEVSLSEKLSELQTDFDEQLKKIKQNLQADYDEKMTLLEHENKAQEEIIGIKDREIVHLKNSLEKYQTYNVSIEPELKTYERLVELGENSLCSAMDTSVEFDDKVPLTSFRDNHVSIVDVCADGVYIKIENTGSNPTNISGWRLIQSNQYEEETIFKFKRGTVLQPAGTITVWSNKSGKVPSIPTDIVMKKNHWYTGNEIKTALISSNFSEISNFSISMSSNKKGKGD